MDFSWLTFGARRRGDTKGRASRHPLFLYNTLGKEKQLFTLPSPATQVRMYNCGPTVYDRQHIGNLSMFVFTDILRRTLEYNGFQVKQVINITDVGHLTSDADEGEDKMAKGLKREKLKPSLENMRILADKYTAVFFEDLSTLNIDTARITFPRASDYIPAQIAMIQTLEEKGYAYRAPQAVYYDATRFPGYGALGGVDIAGLKEGARVAPGEGKRHSTDFALWKLDKKMGWESPWGMGFPGWHIECSAMIRKCLGEQIDIHTGGIEHIPVHHNNEIAQSEAVTGRKPLSRFWMHRAHLQFEGGKLAKSKGNVVYLSDIATKGFHPLALRYLLLGAHYRTSSNFTWEALEAAQTAFLRLRALLQAAPEGGRVVESHRIAFLERISDDLDTAGALSALWALAKDAGVSPADMRATIADMDSILGLRLLADDPLAVALTVRLLGAVVEIHSLPETLRALLDEREKARAEKNWRRADELRVEVESAGYSIEDTSGGIVIKKR